MSCEVFESTNANAFRYDWNEIVEFQMHGHRVSVISSKIAKIMGLDERDIEIARVCAYFHDMGKICVDPVILNKKEALTEREFAVIKNHTIYSQEIMIRKGYFEYSDIVLYHHEKIDGSGYYGLAGKEIPLISRIITLADVYDALCSDRVYRKAYKKDMALKIIEQEKYKYDKDAYKAFTFCV